MKVGYKIYAVLADAVDGRTESDEEDLHQEWNPSCERVCRKDTLVLQFVIVALSPLQFDIKHLFHSQ